MPCSDFPLHYPGKGTVFRAFADAHLNYEIIELVGRVVKTVEIIKSLLTLICQN